MSAISSKELDFPNYIKKFLKSNTKVLKDIDYVKLCKIHQEIFGINITYYERKQLMEILEKDTEFLRDNDLMDYSILIGMEQIIQKQESENVDETILDSGCFDQNDEYQLGKVYSECGNFIYHIFIIDFLQSFNANKKIEIILKRVFKNAKASELSSINPFAYQRRFMNFITKNIFVDPFLNQKLSKQFKLVSIDI